MGAEEMSKCSSHFDIFIFGEIYFYNPNIFFFFDRVSCNGVLKGIYICVCIIYVKYIIKVKHYLHLYI